MKKIRTHNTDYSSLTFINDSFDPCIAEQDEDELTELLKITAKTRQAKTKRTTTTTTGKTSPLPPLRTRGIPPKLTFQSLDASDRLPQMKSTETGIL